jgi:hypothetical protein
MEREVRMTRIDIDEWAWREFKALCLIRGIEVPTALGGVVRGYVKRQKARRTVYEK